MIVKMQAWGKCRSLGVGVVLARLQAAWFDVSNFCNACEKCSLWQYFSAFAPSILFCAGKQRAIEIRTAQKSRSFAKSGLSDLAKPPCKKPACRNMEPRCNASRLFLRGGISSRYFLAYLPANFSNYLWRLEICQKKRAGYSQGITGPAVCKAAAKWIVGGT